MSKKKNREYNFKKLMWRVFERNEKPLGKKERAGVFALDHAVVAKSGYSVGRTQVDFGTLHNRRAELVALLAQTGDFGKRELEDISKGLETQSDPGALSKKEQKKINRALASAAGQDTVRMWDETQMEKLEKTAKELVCEARKNKRFKKDKAFRSFVLSPAFALIVADNANQFGEPDALKKWVRKARGDFSLAALANYESQYRYVRDVEGGADDVKRRRKNIFRVLEEEGLCSKQERKSAFKTLNKRYKPGLI